MRRCTSHTGSSPLWYSASNTPNSVVPKPKRAMLTRECRSTASNARASTTHSFNGTSARLGEAFIPPPGTSRPGRLFPVLFDVKYLDFETISRRYRMFTDLGLLALRLVRGAVFLAHGAQKAFGGFGGPGFEGATGVIRSMGFRPARFWTALAGGGGRGAGVLFLFGLLTPLAGLFVLGTMAVAIAQGHGAKGFFVPNGGEGVKLGSLLGPPRCGG